MLQEKQNVAVNIVKPELTITSLAAGTIPEGATVSTPPLSCTWGSVRWKQVQFSTSMAHVTQYPSCIRACVVVPTKLTPGNTAEVAATVTSCWAVPDADTATCCWSRVCSVEFSTSRAHVAQCPSCTRVCVHVPTWLMSGTVAETVVTLASCGATPGTCSGTTRQNNKTRYNFMLIVIQLKKEILFT